MQKIKKLPFLLCEPSIMFTLMIMICKIYFWGLAENIDTISAPILLTGMGLLLFLLSPAYFLNMKKRIIYLWLLNLGVAIFIIIDLLYYRYFATPISVYVFLQSSNLTDLGPSIFNLFQVTDLLYLVDLPFLAIFIFLRFSRNNRAPRLAGCGLIIGLILACFFPISDLMQQQDGILHRYTANETLYAYGPLGFHFMDLILFVKDQNIQLTPEIRTSVQNWYTLKQQQFKDTVTSSYQNIAKDQNLIIIQVESLQNFVIGKTIDNQEITPNLNSLLKNSLYFPHFYPQTIGGNSSDAELIINTSLFPLEKGSTFFIHPNNTYDSLPVLLKEKGYDTLAIHADEANFWNRHQAFPSLGFNRYYSIEKMRLTELIGMGLSDEQMFKQAIPILQTAQKPFYAMLITLTSHFPYYMPGNKAFLNLSPPLSTSTVGCYLQAIRYADFALGKFIDELRENGFLENSLIVIYGDHNGLFKRDLPEIERVFALKEINDEEWTHDYLPVPLIIYQKDLPGKTIETYGGQVDFFPTVCHLLGINKNRYPYAMGNNLLTVINNYALIPSGDYNDKPVRITKEAIDFSLNSFDRDTLKVADLMIKTNFIPRNR